MGEGRREQAWRLWRSIRWHAKRGLNLRRTITVETRWRLGDEIMALPVYEGLRKAYPECRIAALCHYPELLEDHPAVDVVNAPVTPDRYILLHSGPRTVPRIAHYAQLAGIPTPGERPHLHYADWPAPAVASYEGRFVAVAPGASWPIKRWPLERWRTLCQAIEARGFPVVELGHGDETIGVGKSLMNKTTVREAACVLRAARVLICCDSGLMHLGRAADAPVVALFGPTIPSILVPGDTGLTAVVSEESCQGCWNNEGQDGNPRADTLQPGVCARGRAACMERISVEAVLSRVLPFLTAPRRG